MLSLFLLLFCVVAVDAVAAVVAVVAVCSFFWYGFTCCCLGPHEPSWEALMSPHGEPKLGPIMGGTQVWALIAHGGPKAGPIMGGT
jgi:hypothetical protein